jgi:hypothetical protein
MDPNFHPLFSGDTSDPLFSNFSLQSLLTYNNPSSFFSDNTPPLPNLPETITDQTLSNLNNNNNNENLFLVPKTEHPFNNLPPLDQFLPIQQPFNFFPDLFPPPPPFDSFHRLPQLLSHHEHEKPSKTKRLRYPVETTPPPPPPQQQQQQPHSVRGKSSTLIPQSKLARQRRQKLSEKTRCLQKLMPWDKKMDQATLLEEASKYVKFLQAQYSVLQSMPSHSTTNNNYGGGGNGGRAGGGVFGDLEMLNRNQALQVMVNSPVAQTKLCSQGYCVFTMEQFSLLRKLSERRQLQQKNLSFSDHGSSKSFFH